VKAIKSDSDSDNKRSPGFSGKNKGVTPSVAAPGVTHPSDATDCDLPYTGLSTTAHCPTQTYEQGQIGYRQNDVKCQQKLRDQTARTPSGSALDHPPHPGSF